MHQINMSGLVDQSTAVQLGKVAGAQFMMVGNVTGLTTKKSGIDYQHGSAGSAGVDVRTVIANVSVRLVDIETGQIVGAGLGTGESASSQVEVVFKKYRKTGTDLGYSGAENGDPEEGYPEEGDPEENGGDPEANGGSTPLKDEYSIKIGSQNYSAVQVRNAISKAVRDAIYGDMGLMTMLNDGKKLKVKTGF